MAKRRATTDWDSPVDEHSPFTPLSLAQLVFADHARELADSLRGFVRIYPERQYGPSAAFLEDVAGVAFDAERLLRRAVVAARLNHMSWEDIGEAFGISRQSAHERFSVAEKEFLDVLANPTAVSEEGRTYSRLPYAAEEPEETADRLDAWVQRHLEPGDVNPGDEAVSGGMRRMDPMTEQRWLSDRRMALTNTGELDHDTLVELAEIYEREALVHERLAELGSNAGVWREFAATSRARAAEIRGDLETTPNPNKITARAGTAQRRPAT